MSTGAQNEQYDHRTDNGSTSLDATRSSGPRYRESGYADDHARDRFGGTNLGAAIFGWLVAVAVSILLTSIVGALVAALSSSTSVTQSQAQRDAGTIGVVSALVLVAVLTLGYYTGGYVAGRMSRFDGGRQGLGVWLVGLLVTIVAVVLGAVFGAKYNIVDRVQLPTLPVSTSTVGWGTVVTAVLVVLLTLLAAVMGGKVGHRYHDRVDRTLRDS